MSLPRPRNINRIKHRLAELSVALKAGARANLNDDCRVLETICARIFNALFGLNLTNLNLAQPNFPAADLGDRDKRVAFQITVESSADKISGTAAKAAEHNLANDFDTLTIFFLLEKKPALPKRFTQPPKAPRIDTWDIADLLKQIESIDDLKAIEAAANILDEEMDRRRRPLTRGPFDISAITKYAPGEIIPACSRGRQSTLNMFAGKGIARVAQDRVSQLTLAATRNCMDATKKLPGEGFKRPWPPLIKMDESVKAKVDQLFKR